jgi:hypothetical protein
MKNLIQAAAVTLFAVSVAQAQQAVQWKVSEGGNGHWYGYSLARLDWNAAEQAARVSGGHLATITSSAENAFVASLGLPSAPDLFLSAYWTGGRRPSAGAPFAWITGEPWSFTNWDGPEPNGCCGTDVRFVVFRVHAGSLGRWDDTSVNGNADAHPQWSLIEWSADCNNDGIVDYGQCRDGSLPDYNGNNVPDCCESGAPCLAGSYPVQWRVQDGGNGHWYALRDLPTRPTCTDAAAMAAQVGARLIALETDMENNFFRILRCAQGRQHQSGWQDLQLVGGQWRWGSGAPFSFQSWSRGQPDFGNNATIDWAGASGQCDVLTWGDEICGVANLPSSLFIEWSADCNDDGIVDKGQILRGERPDANDNGIPDECDQVGCRDADFFRDRFVNGADLGILLIQWGPIGEYTVSDLNRDGTVDANDLGVFLSFWGPCPY